MSTKLIIDKKDFHKDIKEDIGYIIHHLYPDALVMFEGEEGDILTYNLLKKIPIDELMKCLKDCHVELRAKRLEAVETVAVSVVKYRGEYYILDGDKKVPIFE